MENKCDGCVWLGECVALCVEDWECLGFVKKDEGVGLYGVETEMDKVIDAERGNRQGLGDCLMEAHKIINGERQGEYGNPEDSFEIIAGYWNVFLREKIKSACHRMGMDKVNIEDLLSPLDTVNMMVLFKQARKLGQKPKRDNYVDSAGYEAIGADRLQVAE